MVLHRVGVSLEGVIESLISTDCGTAGGGMGGGRGAWWLQPPSPRPQGGAV